MKFARGEIGSARAVSRLIEAMGQDKDRSVRWWSAEALNKIGTPVVLQAIKAARANEKDRLARDHMKYLVPFCRRLEPIRRPGGRTALDRTPPFVCVVQSGDRQGVFSLG